MFIEFSNSPFLTVQSYKILSFVSALLKSHEASAPIEAWKFNFPPF